MENKKIAFDKIGEVIAQEVDNVEEVYLDLVGSQEFIVVKFKGGALSVRNASANSLVANLREVSKLLNGGYYNEVPYYTKLKEKSLNESVLGDGFSQKIRDWYMQEHPDDEIGKDLDPKPNFYDLFIALDTYQDVYDVLGAAADTLIRERVFGRLAELMEVDYGYIYDQWLI